PSERKALPVLKVLYRNTQRIQDGGFQETRRLTKVKPMEIPADAPLGELLREAARSQDMQRAEGLFAASADRSLEEAFNALLWAIQDEANVHRFAIAHRAWGLTDVVGLDHAHAILRQCVRFCVDAEESI